MPVLNKQLGDEGERDVVAKVPCPIYEQTAQYGHFGHGELPWENRRSVERQPQPEYT